MIGVLEGKGERESEREREKNKENRQMRGERESEIPTLFSIIEQYSNLKCQVIRMGRILIVTQ